MPKNDDSSPKRPNRYSAIIGTIFKNHYKPGRTQFEFSRDEFVEIAKSLKIALPKIWATRSTRFGSEPSCPTISSRPPERTASGSLSWWAARNIASG